ncbi:MAG: twin-arginine translocase TatA/TatE family subunit [Rhizobiales bacterium]|nr:twin-arginine translocase TatA/TatE family subunit [Hyphomicrobiales bacterium]NRB14481.1 twin-arginine translocase TatA/TatE family subunit [Hyphomicrobiales bacterium]
MPGWTQILLVVILVFLLFGRNKFSSFMGDFAKGINVFKKEMKDVHEDNEQVTLEQDRTSDPVKHLADETKQAIKLKP